ncbi:hypothetical protein SeMB42_g04019 [Synchytrium endobioticum]|uniref:Transcription initiation factor IIF subunit beta n=1 Tax=Synchytrium endobioticum TaxID=286115 RepID=A0A507CQS1_9FUNG|nr:hypothetical protein SeLEV6574_g06058 [Synchytrium endobioticum]TPX45415.1 hypothetical protein SeMB42_g04019 [Synchytrium endobioticum]
MNPFHYSNVQIKPGHHDAELDGIDFDDGDIDDDGDLIQVKPELILPNSCDPGSSVHKNTIKTEPETTGTIRTDQSQHPIWLLKVPKFFTQECQAAFEKGGVELGKIVEHDVPKGAPRKLTLSVADADWSHRLPRRYNLNITQARPRGLHAFTIDPESKAATALVGHVVMEGIAVPIPDERFRALKRERLVKHTEPRKKIELVSKQAAREAEAIGLQGSISRDAMSKQVAAKKTRLERAEAMPKHDLRKELFAAFSEHEFWNFLGLERRTRQPPTWLRESLSEIATVTSGGQYHGLWRLKPEYRIHRDASAAAGDQAS